MKLGIPTLCRYDLLDRLLRSAEAGIVKPSGYIIIDNGGGYGAKRAQEIVGGRPSVSLELIEPGDNWGVARSWNKILSLSPLDPIAISNDDVRLHPETFGELSKAAERGLFVAGYPKFSGWSLFVQSPECTRRVGWYDENFWPAYFEDSDYQVRLKLAGIEPTWPLSRDVEHPGKSTTEDPMRRLWLAPYHAKNQEYFTRKWGHPSAFEPRFDKPFDGNPVPGWKELVG